jgi:hypothetical protein
MAKMGGTQPPVFLLQSAQSLEKKGVAVLKDAKKCKKAQKSAQGIEKKGDSEKWVAKSGQRRERCPPSPANLHEYQKKRLTE